MRMTLLASLLALPLLLSSPAHGLDFYINGQKATGLKGANLQHCEVRFDALGNVHILSPGYRLVLDRKGKPVKIAGSSDFQGVRSKGANPQQKYVLVYQPNAKVSFSYEVFVNNRKFRTIAATSGPFTVDLTRELHAGNNSVRVRGKPVGGATAGSTEADVSKLIIYSGIETDAGAFKAKHPPVWRLFRSAIDRQPIDRQTNIVVQ